MLSADRLHERGERHRVGVGVGREAGEVAGQGVGPVALAAQWLLLVGSVLFPGALYALAFGGPRWMGAVAPIGGAAFIVGWLSLGLAALMRPGAD